MNKEKLTYLSPTTETLVVRFEESVLQAYSPNGGIKNIDGESVEDDTSGWGRG